jgi:phage baseplate assembly protein gpV
MDNVLKNIIRAGRVSSVDPETCSVRVAFEDGLVSYDLPVIVP